MRFLRPPGAHYVELQLVKRGEAPSRVSIVETLQAAGAHLGAQEQVWVVAVDYEKQRSIARAGIGTYHAVTVHLPSLLSVPLLAGAERIVVAHNHPSGRLTPSPHDYDLTADLVNAVNPFGIDLEDHIILGPDGRHFSFSQHGLLTVTADQPKPKELRA